MLVLLLAATTSLKAQEITVAEPEFVNSYCILTSSIWVSSQRRQYP